MQYRIPKEEIQILDDHALGSLFSSELKIDRRFQLKISGFELESEEKISALYKKNPVFIHDEFSLVGNQKAQQLINEGKSVNTYLKTISLPYDEFKNLKNLKNLKDIVTLKIDFKELEISFFELINLCKNFELLETIEFTNLKITDSNQENISDIKLSKIERFSLSAVHFNTKKIIKLFQCLSNLKILEIRDFEIEFASDKEAGFLLKKSLGNLQEISLLNSDINNYGICNNLFLSATEQLKKLTIDIYLSSVHTSLPCLETLEFVCNKNLYGVVETADFNFLEKLQQTAPKLKKLIFHSEFRGIESSLFDTTGAPNAQVNSVIEINISITNIKLEHTIKEIMKVFPKLKKILINPRQFDILKATPLIQQNPHLFEIDFKQYAKLNTSIEKKCEEVKYEEKKLSTPAEVKTFLVDPVFNLASNRDNKPGTGEATFSGKNKTKNQDMIIEKLTHYLTLTEQETEKKLIKIEQISGGMCIALTQLFVEKNNEWEEIINPISNWNGSKEELKQNIKSLEKSFTIIIGYIKKYNSNSCFNSFYIGENIQILKQERTAHLISNPWHVIAIIPDGKDESEPAWIVYDPNYVNGPKRVLESQLPDIIEKQLGLILMEACLLNSKEPSYQETIKSAPDFIKNGGLKVLCNVKNQDDLLESLSKYTEPYSHAALEGLLLRATGGEPLWFDALKNHNKKLVRFTLNLLKQFILTYPNAITELQQSLVNLSPAEQHYLIELLLPAKETESKTDGFTQLIDTLHTNPLTNDYEKRLTTWKKNVAVPVSDLQYSQQLIADQEKSILVQLSSEETLKGFQYAIQKYCQSVNRPYFYIHSPSDLICTDRWIFRDNKNQGWIKPPPGGALFDFLQKNKDKKPILIVNYDNFTASEIVRFNALLDKVPNADGVALPENTKVIGFINKNNPDCYQGSDFYSRFGKIEFCTSSFPLPMLSFNDEEKYSHQIEMYGTQDWENELLGSWKMQNGNLFFTNGLLENAFNSGLAIEFRNGPWTNPKFISLMEQATLLGYIDYAGRRIEVPKNMQIRKSEGYDWSERKKIVSLREEILVEDVPVLNPSLFNEFFSHYKVNENTLAIVPGWIEKNANKSLTIDVTRSISEGQWAKLLDECKKHKVNLIAHCAAGLILPSSLEIENKQTTKDFKMPEHTQIITSNDVDFTIAEFGHKSDEWQIIDVNNLNASDLLIHLDSKWDQKTEMFAFTQTACALLTGLQDGKSIILKGAFSPELIDELYPFLLKRVKEKNSFGKLILLSEQNPFAFIQHDKREVSLQHKLDFLEIQDVKDVKDTSFAHLQAHQRAKGDPWVGMDKLPVLELKNTKINLADSKKISDEFTARRISLVNKWLKASPYVFLSGMTGVGKSTFVQKDFLKELKKESGVLYQGEDEIKKWAEDKSSGRKILFIDEANLSKCTFSQFEGLFHSPPNILINGKIYPLTKDHKVIFAGNPISYGDERKLAPLFANHGNAVYFDPLPPEYIFEHILKPIFEKLSADTYIEKIMGFLLEIYCFIRDISVNEVLISPRELQMMALLIASSTKNCSDDRELIANVFHFSYQIGKDLVPHTYREMFDRRFKFDRDFKPKNNLSTDQKTKVENNFVITASRQPIVNTLDSLLHLRKWRTESKNFNEDQLYGGLGGLILEGNPATGKSDLVIAHLLNKGYVEKHINSTITNEDKNIFYRLPVSMSLPEKEAFLLKAFNEGAIVIIDEINSSAMMERLLNTLTMGKTPKGERPLCPGFMIIGTQNPITMAGRRAPSTALARRLTTLPLPDYSLNELQEILIHRGVNSLQAEQMAKAYQKQLAYATEKQLSPAPTLRDLLKIADESIEEANKMKKKLDEDEIESKDRMVREKYLTGTPEFKGLNLAQFSIDTQAFIILQLLKTYIKTSWPKKIPEPANNHYVVIDKMIYKKQKECAKLLKIIFENPDAKNTSNTFVLFRVDENLKNYPKIFFLDNLEIRKDDCNNLQTHYQEIYDNLLAMYNDMCNKKSQKTPLFR